MPVSHQDLPSTCAHESWLTYRSRCGKQFCYVCGLKRRTCDCELWHENRLYGIANRGVEDEVHAGADAAERGEALARAVNGLQITRSLAASMGVDRNGFIGSVLRCNAKSAITIFPSISSSAEAAVCWHVTDAFGTGCVDPRASKSSCRGGHKGGSRRA
jgi:hypothetical protein